MMADHQLNPPGTECETKRGGIFHSNQSSTWTDVGLFRLGLDPKLGFGGNGAYGFDSIALSDQLSVQSQTVAVINTTDYWLGFMGLGITPTNFSAAANGTNSDKKTYLSSLAETAKVIPSRSYGYTAGAYYRETKRCPCLRLLLSYLGLKHVPSSLTLGGYDANRFTPHNVTFDLDPNLDPVVALNGISVTASPLPGAKSTGWSGSSQILLGPSDNALYTIDSSTPYLWLPETVCLRFEKALGLTYDKNVRLYTFSNDSTQPDVLVNWNLTFNFIIADLPASSKVVSLTLPYSAFDLELTYPFPDLNKNQSSPATKYFPLRKADNDTQYTLGRAFLQETYLKVDYERNKFSVYQAIFATDATSNINLVDVLPPDTRSLPGGQGTLTGHGLSKGVIIGIAIGGVVVALILIFLFYCIRKRGITSTQKADEKQDAIANMSWIKRVRRWVVGTSNSQGLPEADGTAKSSHQLDADTNQCYEMPVPLVELPGGEVEETLYQESQRKQRMIKAINPVDHDPKKPVELQHSTSTGGYYGHEIIAPAELDSGPDTSPALLTPHSPSQIGRHLGRRDTQTTEVSSRSRSSRASTNISTPMIISPVTPHHPSPNGRSLDHPARRNQSFMYSDESDLSEQETADNTLSPQTPQSNGGDRMPISTPTPQPSPGGFSHDRQP